MRLPVDTAAMTLVAMAAPEPVVDYATRKPKTDQGGEPLYLVQVAAMFADQGEVLAVKVTGEPSGITPGTTSDAATSAAASGCPPPNRPAYRDCGSTICGTPPRPSRRRRARPRGS